MSEEEVDRRLETLPAPAAGREDAPGRGLARLAGLLVALGWLSGAAVAILALLSAWFIHDGRPQDIPLGLFDDLVPRFRDRPSVYAIVVAGGGLLLSLVPVIVVAGMGHFLRVLVSLERGVRRLVDRLEERET